MHLRLRGILRFPGHGRCGAIGSIGFRVLIGFRV